MANSLYGNSMRVPKIHIKKAPMVFGPRRPNGSIVKSLGGRLIPQIKKRGSQLLIVIMLGVLFSIVLPSLLGCRFEVIRSGSMSPAIDTGSLVITRPINSYSIEIGDVIAFYPPASPDTMIVHRVAGIDNGAPLSFLTKGDANNSLDPYRVPAGSVAGQVTYHIPWIGYLISFMQSIPGFLVFIVTPAVIIIYMEINKLLSLLGERKTTGKRRGKTFGKNNLSTGYKQLYRSVSK